ncbi:ribbon-helix-helix protein, CopG family [Micromonospora vulcania]|uniref:Ribbon-helix-helix protein, CopG family n=1 Tax=Micromonospora vulcania TaxID=1441873 RepID=A0ABW1H841_9ACTN
MNETSMPRLVKVTVNLTRPTDAALTRLAAGQGSSRTDALNRAVRLATLLHEMAPNGHFKIVLTDGLEKDIYLV